MSKTSAAKATEMVRGAVKGAAFMDARNETDTIRLWENYKDQALLWRSLALLQIPTTLITLVFSLILWHTRQITLQVPREPLPGVYSAKEIPNEKFMEVSTELVNLIATYTPATARAQFKKAKEFLKEPLLAKFEVDMVGTELKAIENTSRTQIFFADPTKSITARLSDTEVQVQIDGTRLKIVAGQELPPSPTRYLLTLTTIPRNALNPYGIVVTNIQFAPLKPEKD